MAKSKRRARRPRRAAVVAAPAQAAEALAGKATPAASGSLRQQPDSKDPLARKAEQRRSERTTRRPALRDRPQAPWHPLPLSEILIVVGVAAITIGVLSGGPQQSAPALISGVLAVTLGTGEITLREHLAGYRSHALLLALLPAVIFHSVLVLGLDSFTTIPKEMTVLLLAVDAAIFFTLHRLLRARFEEVKRP